jgi:hypothetical protein
MATTFAFSVIGDSLAGLSSGTGMAGGSAGWGPPSYLLNAGGAQREFIAAYNAGSGSLSAYASGAAATTSSVVASGSTVASSYLGGVSPQALLQGAMGLLAAPQTKATAGRVAGQIVVGGAATLVAPWTGPMAPVVINGGRLLGGWAGGAIGDWLFNSQVPEEVGPGPYAGEPIPAGPSATPTKEQQDQINAEGEKHGCHTCGTRDPGTKSGNWIGDHQPPTALNPPGNPQNYYPHCRNCSNSQGGRIRWLK